MTACWVIAQNFPGTGNSDRSPDDEVATVRKSLDQLTQIELAPFFSVTSLAAGDPGRIDGVMVSHIRYQGFQGNIRATTKPISLTQMLCRRSWPNRRLRTGARREA